MSTVSPLGPSGPAPRTTGWLALLLGAAVCGFGLGALVLALPGGGDDPLPPVPPLVLTAPPAPDASATRAATRPDWPELFGAPAPEPEPEPLALDDDDEDWDEPDPIEDLDARLKGVALDDRGGWALIEIDDRVQLFRPGMRLTPDHVISEILSDAVMLETPEGEVELRFADPEPGEPLGRRNAPGRPMLQSRRDLDDRLRGMIAGERRSSPTMRRDRMDEDDDWFDDDDDWPDDD